MARAMVLKAILVEDAVFSGPYGGLTNKIYVSPNICIYIYILTLLYVYIYLHGWLRLRPFFGHTDRTKCDGCREGRPSRAGPLSNEREGQRQKGVQATQQIQICPQTKK